jgi:uncharacterized protein (TIGR02996 family)
MRGNLEGGFLEDIIAHIDDDTPRLVYADWLMENGHDDRAEFIRVQIQRSRLPEWDPAQVALRLREKELLDAHGKAWLGELPKIKGVEWLGFRRGIVAEVGFSNFGGLRANLGKVRATAPLEAVTTPWPSDGGENVTAQSLLSELRELTLHGRPWGDDLPIVVEWPQLATLHTLNVLGLAVEDLSQLLASPHLGKLRRLRLLSNGIGNAGVGVLTQSPLLTSLEELDLTGAGYYDSYYDDPAINVPGFEALAQWPGLASVRKLVLTGSDPGETGLAALLASPFATGLKELILRNARIKGAMLPALLRAHPDLRLEKLDLHSNKLDQQGMEMLAVAGCLGEVRHLGIDRCEIKPGMFKAFVEQSRNLDGLRVLNVAQNEIGPTGLRALLDRAPAALHTLKVSDNDLHERGATVLARSPASDTLLELDLGKNGIGPLGVQALAETQHLGKLLILRVHDNDLSGPSLELLENSPLGQRLKVLGLKAPEREWGYMPPYEEDEDYYEDV